MLSLCLTLSAWCYSSIVWNYERKLLNDVFNEGDEKSSGMKVRTPSSFPSGLTVREPIGLLSKKTLGSGRSFLWRGFPSAAFTVTQIVTNWISD